MIFLFFALLIISVIDAFTFKIHNVSVFILLIYGIFFYGGANWWNALFVLSLLVGLKFVLERFFKKDTLGYGDVKLMAVLAVFMPFMGIPYFIFISGLLSSLYIAILNKKHVPFAPFISIAFLITLLFLGNVVL